MSATHPSENATSIPADRDKRERPVLALVGPGTLPADEDVTEAHSNLRRVISEAINLFRQAQRDERNMQIVASIPDRFPMLPADPLRLRQVLRMLLRLAAASVPAGGELEVAAESAPRDRAGPCVQVIIRPHGTAPGNDPGNDAGNAPGNDPVNDKVPSNDQLGSGLTAARSFAESFGGQIHCRSRHSDAPEFVVLIPRY